MKKISIIISAYNVERFVAHAIQSALDQSYPNLELLIVDDASTDHTLEVIRTFRDSRIRLIQLDKNIGLGNVLNKAMNKVSGDYFMFLDGDDRLTDCDVIAQLASATKECPHLVRGKMRRWFYSERGGESVNEYSPIPYDETISASPRPVTLKTNPEIIQIGSSNQFLINKKWADSIGVRFRLSHFEDALFVNELLIKADAILLTDVTLFDYRKEKGVQRSLSSRTMHRADIDLYMQHVDIIFDLYSGSFEESDLLYRLNVQRYVQRLCGSIYKRISTQDNGKLLRYYLESIRKKFALVGVSTTSLEQFLNASLEGVGPPYITQKRGEGGYYRKFLFLLENKRYREIEFLNNAKRVLRSLEKEKKTALMEGFLAIHSGSGIRFKGTE